MSIDEKENNKDSDLKIIYRYLIGYCGFEQDI
jgi:hypothetical protein